MKHAKNCTGRQRGSRGFSQRGKTGSEMARGRRVTAVPISADGGASPCNGGASEARAREKLERGARETRGGGARLRFKEARRGEGRSHDARRPGAAAVAQAHARAVAESRGGQDGADKRARVVNGWTRGAWAVA